jgi:ankyrin repeat protein
MSNFQLNNNEDNDIDVTLFELGNVINETNPLLNEYRKSNFSIEKICELINIGVDVNAINENVEDDKRHTILYEACSNEDEQMVELLLSKGADPNKYYENQASRLRSPYLFSSVVRS